MRSVERLGGLLSEGGASDVEEVWIDGARGDPEEAQNREG